MGGSNLIILKRVFFVVTLPNYMKLILNFRLFINFDHPIPLCAVHADPTLSLQGGAKSPSWTCKLSHLTLPWAAHTAKRSSSIMTKLSSPGDWCVELWYNQGGERKKKRKCDLPALPSRGDVSGLPSPRSPCVSGADGPGAGTI
jgi:hypothetical protein